jgi:hypothetical protein
MRIDPANLPILASHNKSSEPIADTDFLSITNMIKTERDAKVLYICYVYVAVYFIMYYIDCFKYIYIGIHVEFDTESISRRGN